MNHTKYLGFVVMIQLLVNCSHEEEPGISAARSNVDLISKSCSTKKYSEEVSISNGYHLRYLEKGNGLRAYFVFDERTNCSFAIDVDVDPDVDTVWLTKLAELTANPRLIKGFPFAIAGFLNDRSLEIRIIDELLAKCMDTKSMEECEGEIGVQTINESIILDVRKGKGVMRVDFFMGQAFVNGELI